MCLLTLGLLPVESGYGRLEKGILVRVGSTHLQKTQIHYIHQYQSRSFQHLHNRNPFLILEEKNEEM